MLFPDFIKTVINSFSRLIVIGKTVKPFVLLEIVRVTVVKGLWQLKTV